jgi:glycosyltransferase involved in cell wall biosynthesis
VLCMFDPSSPLHRIGSPNKLYEAMAAGRPLIASAGTYVGDFVQAHGVGIVAPHDIEGLRKAALHLRDHPNEARAMGKRGRTLARSIYNWPKQAEHLLELYAEAPWATS